MKYYAHSADCPKENWQLLKTHLENTALKVKQFSNGYCGESLAENLGLLHDVGKFSLSFQQRLDGKNIKVEHSLAGAKELNFGLMQYCIAGHHSGLMDIGTRSDSEEASTLFGRLKRKCEDYSAYKSEIAVPELSQEDILKCKSMADDNKQAAFWTRFMFSCLTDADFLDTEEFYDPSVCRGSYIDFKCCLDKIDRRLSSFAADTAVKQARSRLCAQAASHAYDKGNIFFLNMPTGSGKTLAGMKFALMRAIEQHKKHIIYVIPYTSIIEQNAAVFKGIFGNEGILEHHSNFNYDSIDDFSIKEKLKKAAENWDVSIVVTTNVRFFQSIYSNKSSDLRKMHNIADSIILFDDVHTLPSKFFKPCLEAIATLTKKYSCEAVFMSATMPDFNRWLTEFGCTGLDTVDLIQDKSDFDLFKTSTVTNLGAIDFDSIISRINSEKHCLVVVNKKSTALKVYRAIPGKKFHLSTYMTHFDRDRVIKQVREALASDEPFCLVSTSLIEAGVDLDFTSVYRELMGLDNLLQTAGRCNREGKRKSGSAYSFEFTGEEFAVKSNEVKIRQGFTNEIFRRFENVNDTAAVTAYFNRLYQYGKGEMSQMDFANYITSTGFNFKSYAQDFKLIDDNSIALVILDKDAAAQQLIKNAAFNPSAAKRGLQKYTISLKKYEYDKLNDYGVIGSENGIEYLANANFYDVNTGIGFEDNTDYIY